MSRSCLDDQVNNCLLLALHIVFSLADCSTHASPKIYLYRHKRAADDVGSCGMDRVKEWMDKVSKSAVEDITNRQRHKRVRFLSNMNI